MIVLRAFATSQLTNRAEPYRGHDGVHAYPQDVANVWDELMVHPVRAAPDLESVIGFARPRDVAART